MQKCNRPTSTGMEAHPARTFGIEGAEAGAGAMLVACRLAGLSALETYYAGARVGAQCGAALVHTGRALLLQTEDYMLTDLQRPSRRARPHINDERRAIQWEPPKMTRTICPTPLTCSSLAKRLVA
jgi:hypothetical protein